MIVGAVTETFPAERRAALVPGVIASLKKSGLDTIIQSGAGLAAGFPDAAYERAGAKVAPSREEVFLAADIIVQVRTPGANPSAGAPDIALSRHGQVLIGLADPLTPVKAIDSLASRGVTLFAMELIPRTTRAQAMDVLSSQATVAGYEAVLLAASALPKMFPMMMTAAGTISPARVLILGAGVAGLQAIATARRLGAVVEAYDIRAAVKEQIESLGARFVDLKLESSGGADGAGGYAKAMDAAFYKAQQEALAKVVAASDAVICTAAIPGRKSPLLVTAAAVAAMAPGSVIVDLAAERGGNCELTRPDERTTIHGVTIYGPTNLPSAAPYHASQMYAKNITNLLQLMIKKGVLTIDDTDDIIKETLITRDGQIVNQKVRQALNLSGLQPKPTPP